MFSPAGFERGPSCWFVITRGLTRQEMRKGKMAGKPEHLAGDEAAQK